MAQDASKGRLGLTRRIFLAGATGSGLARRTVVWEAIAAERMPHRIVVHDAPSAPFLELRDYERVTASMLAIFKRYGMRPVLSGRGRLLIPFESLGAREEAWRGVSGDRDWVGAAVVRIAVYRMV